MSRYTVYYISPWFVSVCTAVLALDCLGITLWQGGRMMMGLTTWEENGLELILAQKERLERIFTRVAELGAGVELNIYSLWGE